MFTLTSCCFVVTQSNNYDDHNKFFSQDGSSSFFLRCGSIIACLQMRSEKGKNKCTFEGRYIFRKVFQVQFQKHFFLQVTALSFVKQKKIHASRTVVSRPQSFLRSPFLKILLPFLFPFFPTHLLIFPQAIYYSYYSSFLALLMSKRTLQSHTNIIYKVNFL